MTRYYKDVLHDRTHSFWKFCVCFWVAAILDLRPKNTFQYPMDVNNGNPIQINYQNKIYLILFHDSEILQIP